MALTVGYSAYPDWAHALAVAAVVGAGVVLIGALGYLLRRN